MNDLQILLKPVSGLCNLRCAYCFYADEVKRRREGGQCRMDTHTADALIDRALETARRSVTFAFQGGEPMLAGLPFYEYFVHRVKEKNKKRVAVRYVMQTNGVLVDAAWTDFFKRHAFLIGLSLDGPKDVHDRFRMTQQDKGSHAAAFRAAQMLRSAGVEVNVLCVLTGESARSIGSIYHFYIKNGFSYQQYIPCLNPLGDEGVYSYTLTDAAYARALKTLFDAYWADMSQGRYVYIRQFENYVGMLRGAEPENCTMRGHCGIQFVVEADGSVYPCDFYALDAYCLGNVRTHTLAQMACSDAARDFLLQGEKQDAACAGCRYFPLCRGGCRRERGDGINGGRLRFCAAYREFFDYAIGRLARL